MRQLGELATVIGRAGGHPGGRGARATSPTGSSSPTVPATRPRCPASSRRSAPCCSDGRSRSSASASATSCSPPRSAARTYKLPFGHHGGNHPVQQAGDGPGGDHLPEPQLRGRPSTPSSSLEVTHVNLNDGVVEGLASRDVPAFSVQYHPEAGPGPHDARYLFEEFRALMDATGAAQVPAAVRSRLMPRRDDLESILVIGSGPIVIGQACEFDYSGTQACRVLAEEGFRVVLANSNPATIMTDPGMADRTYVEPLDPDVARGDHRAGAPGRAPPDARRPDRAQPDHGPRRAAAPSTSSGSRSSAPNAEAIATAENRERFKAAMEEIGLVGPRFGLRPLAGRGAVDRCVDRLPGHGPPELHPRRRGNRHRCRRGRARPGSPPRRCSASPVNEVLVEQSIAGQKEFELEVMRDHADNCVVICSIENFDPMGVHTGDSITVAPAQTLTDVEYQTMRDAAFACIRRVGVETGGSNVQFAVDPANGSQRIIEMNPRVSRSSALASKATGFPIAKIAARLAVGYRLDEIVNDITGATPASFEPTIDYVVTKIPRWAFEKLPGSTDRSRHEDAVGGRGDGHRPDLPRVAAEGGPLARAGPRRAQRGPDGGLARRCARPRSSSSGWPSRRPSASSRSRPCSGAGTAGRASSPRRPASIRGSSPRSPRSPTARMALDLRVTLGVTGPTDLDRRTWRGLKRLGLLRPPARPPLRGGHHRGLGPSSSGSPPASARPSRRSTPAAPSSRPARRTTTRPPRTRTRWAVPTRQRVIILGSGPNRIGQGIEFDYCCVHASLALRDAAGYETVMVNCNPETVSTDYDTSDRLYFEPLTDEDLANVIGAETGGLGGGGPAGRGDRQPRWADTAQAGRGASPRYARPRDLAGLDRPRRGPRAVERALRAASASASHRAGPR